MKNFTRILISAAALMFGVLNTSCEKNDGGELDGTYTYQSIYDIVYYFKDGERVSFRDEDLLDEAAGDFEDFIDMMSALSFNFSGSTCTLMMGGMTSSPGTYSLTGDRLVIRADGAVFSFMYKTSPQTMFIWDMDTFRAMGTDISSLTGLGLVDFELWIAMRRK